MADESSIDLMYPAWQAPLQAALLEFDPAQLRQRIAAAEEKIQQRLKELDGEADGRAERQSISDALSILSFLKERVARLA